MFELPSTISLLIDPAVTSYPITILLLDDAPASALYPRITLLEPPTIASPVRHPIRTFEPPDVIEFPASWPTAVFLLPVDFLRASSQTAVFCIPVAYSPALAPIYVVPPFVVVYEPALYPI